MNGYRLVRRGLVLPPPAPPVLDEAQQRVVDHKGGPLLVLAGPGTGKTTTIVSAVAERLARRAGPTCEPLALTFHSYAYALVRREFVLAGDQPPRLLSAPEQLLEIRRMLRGEVGGGPRHLPA